MTKMSTRKKMSTRDDDKDVNFTLLIIAITKTKMSTTIKITKIKIKS